MTVAPAPSPESPVKPPSAFRPISARRKARDRLARVAFAACFVIALVPLVALLGSVLVNGGPAITDPVWWTGDKFGVDVDSYAGGVGHAVLGTLLQALVASVIAVPVGVLTAILLVEYPRSRIARPATFMVDVLAGVPSIVAAIFVFGVWVTTLGNAQSAFAVSLALVLLMVPVVVRSTEEMLKLVPDELREAAYALGVPKWKTIVRIVIPTALSGMISGVFLALARIMGETAPVLVLVGATDAFNLNVLDGNMNSLPLFIKEQVRNPDPALGAFNYWGAALTLVIIIAAINAVAVLVAKLVAPKG